MQQIDNEIGKNNEHFPILLCPFCLTLIPEISFQRFNTDRLLIIECSCFLKKKQIELNAYLNIIKRKYGLNESMLNTELLFTENKQKEHFFKNNPPLPLTTCDSHHNQYSFYCHHCEINLCSICIRNHCTHLCSKLMAISLHSCRDKLNKINLMIQDQKKYKTLLIESINNYASLSDVQAIDLIKEIEKAYQLHEANSKDLKDFYAILVSTLLFLADTPIHQMNQIFDNIAIKQKDYKQCILDNERKGNTNDGLLMQLNEYLGNTSIYSIRDDVSKIITGHTDSVYCLIKNNQLDEVNQHQLQYHHELVSSSDDNSVKVWDTTSGECTKTIDEHQVTVYCMIQLKRGLFAFGCDDHSIKLFDSKSFKCIASLISSYSSITCLVELTNGQLVSGSLAIIFWNITTKSSVTVINGHDENVNSIIQLDDELIASAADDKLIKIWNIKTLQCERIIGQHTESVHCLILFNDNQIASCSRDNTIRLWNRKTFLCDTIIKVHNDQVNCIIRLHDGRLVSCSTDCSIIIWNRLLFKCEKVLLRHNDDVNYIIQLNDDQIASSSNDNSIIIWNI